MGIIIKQSIRNSMISYAGALLGAVNVLIIYERMLDPEELGQIKFILATAFLFLPIVLLGAPSIQLRFFPRFESIEKRNHGILGYAFALFLSGYILFLIFSLIFYRQLPDKFSENYILIILLLVFLAASSILTSYSSSLREISIPAFFNNLWVKLGMGVIVVLYFYDYLSFTGVKWGLIVVYAIGALGILTFIQTVNKLFLKPDFSILTRENVREIRSYSLYSAFGPIGVVFATQLDQFMVTEILSYESGGIYTIAVYIASAFSIPMMAVFSIANPIISEASDKNDYDNIKNIYQKSSINLLVLGLLIMLLLWTNIDELFSLMSNSEVYSKGKYVVLIIGIAKIIDMSTSVNGAIIAHSQYYRFNLYILLVLSVVNIVANIFLIKSLGIIGAAWATFLSLACFNLGKLFFVKYRFGLQPFSRKSLIITVIALSLFLLFQMIPLSSMSFLLRISFRAILIIIVFFFSIYYLRISEEMRNLIIETFKKLKNV